MKKYKQIFCGGVTPNREKLKEVEQKLKSAKEKFLELFDKEDRDYINNHTYFAGGCIYSLYNDKPISDFDIFCDNQDSMIFVSSRAEKHRDAIFSTENAVTLHLTEEKPNDFCDYTIYDFQVIKKFYGEPEDVIGEFDFYHNFFAYIKGKIISFYNWRYLATTRLCFNHERGRDIVNVLLRIPKFIKKGFYITKEEHGKIMLKALQDKEQEILELQSAREHY